MRVGAIDCGTNSTRLLVKELGPGEAVGATVRRLTRITRLGQGVDRDRRFDPVAMDRTLDALRDYGSVLDEHQVARRNVRVTATSAARDADNRDDLFDRVDEVLGVRPELLSGDAEARLAFQGATAELAGQPDNGLLLVADIGGGSTELVVGVPGEKPIGAVSLDIGCVRLTEQHLTHDPPRPEELSEALAVIRDAFEDAVQDVPALRDADRLIGLAGTVTTAAAVELGLVEYDRDRIHHFELTRDAAEDVFRTLAMGDRDDRLANPGLEAARADVIVGGLCVLVSVYRFFGFESCLVSESDILDGLAASIAAAGDR